MICMKCGAPIPEGKTVCPYCGWQGTAPQRNGGNEEETMFAPSGGQQIPSQEQDETVFAGFPSRVSGGGQPPAQPAPARKNTPPVVSLPPVPPAKKREPRPKREKPARPEREQKTQVSPLHIALLAVLAILIVLLILRSFIPGFLA